jgi:hypothetical protein
LSDQTWGILLLPEKAEIPEELSNEPPNHNMDLLAIKSGEENHAFLYGSVKSSYAGFFTFSGIR